MVYRDERFNRKKKTHCKRGEVQKKKKKNSRNDIFMACIILVYHRDNGRGYRDPLFLKYIYALY